MQSLEDHKAQNIVVLDVRGQAYFADYIVIASGTSTRHVSSLGSCLEEKASDVGFKNVGIEGQVVGDWVVVDLMDVVIHIFHHEKRELYGIENMWSFRKEP